MISIKVDGVDAVRTMLAAAPKQASRAVETALDFTAKHIQSNVQREMLSEFKRPVDYTIKSVKTTLTKGHNMTASVWIATPSRMEQSYLVPQVDGGARKLKGFERGFDDEEFVPGSGAKLNASGNIPVATIKKARAEVLKKRSEFVRISEKRGKLWPGVYQRVKSDRGFGRKNMAYLAQRGRKRGKFTSAIQARGLKPIMLEGRTGHKVKPQLDFYGVAQSTFDAQFRRKFDAAFASLVGR